MQALSFKTMLGKASGEFKDRGSRFLAYAFGVKDAADIKVKIAGVKEEHPRATHHCIGWRLGTDGTQYRAADDGEPSGSAGRPILGTIDSFGLTNVLVVVVRYYGGTMLGVPGLINAYKTAAGAALSTATLADKAVTRPIKVTFDYPAMGEVLYILKGAAAEDVVQDLGLFCVITAAVPLAGAEACRAQLAQIRGVEVTGG